MKVYSALQKGFVYSVGFLLVIDQNGHDFFSFSMEGYWMRSW